MYIVEESMIRTAHDVAHLKSPKCSLGTWDRSRKGLSERATELTVLVGNKETLSVPLQGGCYCH